MQLQEVKSNTLELNGLIFEIERVGSLAKRVEIKTRGGQTKLVLHLSSYCVDILEPAPPKMKRTNQMVVELNGTKVTYTSDDLQDLKNKAIALEIVPGCQVSEIEEIEVEDV